MDLKKIWFSPNTFKRHRFGLWSLGSIYGIALLMLMIILGGTFLSFYLDFHTRLFSVFLCFGATLLALVLALRAGSHSAQNAMVFFLTATDRLYALDARTLSNYGHNVISYSIGVIKTQNYLHTLSQNPYLPSGAEEILKVKNLKETRTCWIIHCQIRHPNRHVLKKTYFLSKNFENFEQLLQQLELRKNWRDSFSPENHHNLLYAGISGLILILDAALCVLSHPFIGRLPQMIYFPCLGLSIIPGYLLIYFLIRHHRGE